MTLKVRGITPSMTRFQQKTKFGAPVFVPLAKPPKLKLCNRNLNVAWAGIEPAT